MDEADQHRGGQRIWHIYNGGYHYISYSYKTLAAADEPDDSIGLLILEHDGAGTFKEIADITIYDGLLGTKGGSSFAVAEGFDEKVGDTNDHCLAALTTGVAVCVRRAGSFGALLIHLSSTGDYVTNSFVGELGILPDVDSWGGTGGSVVRSLPRKWYFFASQTLEEDEAGDILLFELDRTLDSSAGTVTTLRSFTDYNLAMPTAVFGSDWRIVTYRRFEKRAKGGGDDGNIYRIKYDKTWAAFGAPEEFEIDVGTDDGDLTRNRPHTIGWRYGSAQYLLTTWSSGSSCYLRVERIFV